MASSTQDSIPILDIQDGVATLKDGGALVVLKTSAVNFGLLSSEEQISIISSFAQMLNSLSFSIQIVIRSTRLDITAYLHLLDKSLQLQTNPLLSQMMIRYRDFVQSLIKDNEVLDKSFYVVVALSSLELGLAPKKEDRFKKAMNILGPRRDQVIRQLGRVGLKAEVLDTKSLVKLLYDIYNPNDAGTPITQAKTTPASLPQMVIPPTFSPPIQSTPHPAQAQPNQVIQQQTPVQVRQSRSHPFVVEELNP